jgi:hypothetical protein
VIACDVNIRLNAGLRPGVQIEIRLEGAALFLTRAHSVPNRGRRIVEHLRGRASGEGLSTDEIMALTRGE